jgi:tubulin polyglutamylase TTLL6/13
MIDDWNICWYDTYISEDDLRRMLPFQKINHFPCSYNLGKKNLLCKNLAKLRKMFPEEYGFYPRSWQCPYQLEEVRQLSLSSPKSKVFIVKPEASCQGRGIFLTKKIDGVLSNNDHYVVQEYVDNPYLIDGLKFDFRIYVLLKSVSPLKIFMYREGLARFATEQYKKPKKSNMTNKCMHLTNYAVNKKNPNFVFNNSAANDTIGHKRSFSSVLKVKFRISR